MEKRASKINLPLPPEPPEPPKEPEVEYVSEPFFDGSYRGPLIIAVCVYGLVVASVCFYTLLQTLFQG